MGTSWRRIACRRTIDSVRETENRLDDSFAAPGNGAGEARHDAEVRIRENMPPWLRTSLLRRSRSALQMRRMRQLPRRGARQSAEQGETKASPAQTSYLTAISLMADGLFSCSTDGSLYCSEP